MRMHSSVFEIQIAAIHNSVILYCDELNSKQMELIHDRSKKKTYTQHNNIWST